jgi:hypothetical protein
MKIFTTSVFCLLFSNLILQLSGFFEMFTGIELLPSDWNNYFYGSSIFLGVVVGIFWDRIKLLREASERALIILQRFIRFTLCYSICEYGFAKILKGQFSVPDHIKVIPIGELDGFWLTWYYFGFSYPFTLVIGIGQIGGSFLLLFSKTRLLGTFILLPIMVNIVCVDIFYNIHTGALMNAIIYTISLIFLLMLNYKELVVAFFPKLPSLPIGSLGNSLLKNSLRILVIGLALGLSLYLENKFKNRSVIKGVYETDMVALNNKPIFKNNEMRDSIFSKAYFDYEVQVIFDFKDHKTRTYNAYQVNTQTKTVSVFFNIGSRGDSIRASYSNQDRLEFTGKFGSDSLKVTLNKIE